MKERKIDVPDAQSPDGLTQTIAATGQALAQAAEELQRAADRLAAAEGEARRAEEVARTAEEKVRAAEDRAREAEAALAESTNRTTELLGLVEQAREQQAEADKQCRRAEQRLTLTQEHARLMETQLHDLEARLEEAESHPHVPDQERESLHQAAAAEARRPLTSILGLTLALKHHDPNSSEGKEMVRQLAIHARKLDRLVSQLVDLDKLVAGTLPPNRRRTDLGALVERVIDETPDLANRDVRFESPGRVSVSVDPALAEQMVDALLGNAGRRTVSGNMIWVKVEPAEGGAVIAVDDAGPEVPGGLKQALLASIQERPGADGQSPRGATGLLLLTRLAEIHGGKAWVEERPGGGTSFRVFLPDVSDRPVETEGEDRGVAALAPHQEVVEPAPLGEMADDDRTITI
jgi:signal transduction histidine kinase